MTCEALDLEGCNIGAFLDDEGNQFLEVDGIDEVLVCKGEVGKKEKEMKNRSENPLKIKNYLNRRK
ncbi:MAG: hypothetical protein ACTSVI_01435 [Promethearchaeota archaeon]